MIDILNPCRHEDAEKLQASVAQMVRPLGDLLSRAQSRDTITIYVNDNQDDFSATRWDAYLYVILMSLPLIVVFAVAQPKIISGITSGAVK